MMANLNERRDNNNHGGSAHRSDRTHNRGHEEETDTGIYTQSLTTRADQDGIDREALDIVRDRANARIRALTGKEINLDSVNQAASSANNARGRTSDKGTQPIPSFPSDPDRNEEGRRTSILPTDNGTINVTYGDGEHLIEANIASTADLLGHFFEGTPDTWMTQDRLREFLADLSEAHRDVLEECQKAVEYARSREHLEDDLQVSNQENNSLRVLLEKRTQQFQDAKDKIKSMTDSSAELAQVYAQLNSILDQWEQDKNKLATLEQENESLKNELQALLGKARIQHIFTPPAPAGLNTRADSVGREANSHARVTSPTPVNRHILPRGTPLEDFQPEENTRRTREATLPTVVSRATSYADNARWPDPPMFDGIDRKKYPQWKRKVQQKLRNSKGSFPGIQNEIDYIASRTEDLAYDVIADRASPDAADPYDTTKDLWRDMDYAFEDDDKSATAEAELFNLGKMRMRSDETFEEFLVRFLRTINQIEHMRKNDKQKITHLRRLVSIPLQSRVSGFSTSTGQFSDFVDLLRTHARNIENIKTTKPRGKDPSAQSKVSSSPASSSGKPAIQRRPNDLYTKAKKNNRCFKCGEKATNSKEHNSSNCPNKRISDNEFAKLFHIEADETQEEAEELYAIDDESGGEGACDDTSSDHDGSDAGNA